MDPLTELSKSRLFTVKDGTIFLAEESESDFSQPDRQSGSIIDKKYQILGLLGKGGMGAVYRARHLMLNKDVALKTFRSANLTEQAILRFQREAQAISKLNHKNVIHVFDFGLAEDGVPYYTMEYLSGETLGDRLKKNGPLTVAEAIKLFIQICQGLALAHSKGIIHRDLKPTNLFIESSLSTKGKIEIAKIVDFGIASLTNQSSEGQKLTTLGTVFGSPLYMSPEQSMGQAITERADIYSLGCTLFEALSGTPPFVGVNALGTIMMHDSHKPKTLKEASGGRDYPSAMELAVATMLAKSPGDRQSSIDQVAAELSQVMPGKHAVVKQTPPATHKTAAMPNPGAPAPDTPEDAPPHQDKMHGPLTLAATILSIGIAIIGYLSFNRPMAQESPSKTSAPCRKTEQGPDGKTYIRFIFPQNLKLGTFKDLQFPGGEISATTEVRWLAGRPPMFKLSPSFLLNPANLDVFQPDDLWGLDLSDCLLSQKGSSVAPQIARLTGLRMLDLKESEITDNDLSELKKLSHLIALSVDDTDIHGAALAALPQTKQLDFVGFKRCAGAADLLTALQGSQYLENLLLDEDSLTPADFKTIATLSNLRELHVNNTGMTVSDLASLTSLKKLKALEAKGLKLTKEATQSLKVMKKNGLENLRLSATGLSDADKKLIRMIIPKTGFSIPARDNVVPLLKSAGQRPNNR